MFDAPGAELGAGVDGADHSKYDPALIRESMSGVIRRRRDCVILMAPPLFIPVETPAGGAQGGATK